jgi:Phage integrase family
MTARHAARKTHRVRKANGFIETAEAEALGTFVLLRDFSQNLCEEASVHVESRVVSSLWARRFHLRHDLLVGSSRFRGRLTACREAACGTPSVHPFGSEELRALRRLRREQPDARHVFQSERDAPTTPLGFRTTLARIGEASGVGFPVHPHMLRHACGFKPSNDGERTRALQRYLGHGNIQTRSAVASWRRAGSTGFGRIEKRASSPGRVQEPHQIGGLRLEDLVAFR